MKQLFKSMGVSLATGIAFVVGISVAGIAFDSVNGGWQDEKIHVNLPEGVTIEEHQRRPGDKFLVEGVIRNATEHDWQSIYVEMTIFAGDAKMNNCDAGIKGVVANSTRQFRIQCFGVSGSGLPSNVRYDIVLSHGFRAAET
jgi:hypothetical protein